MTRSARTISPLLLGLTSTACAASQDSPSQSDTTAAETGSETSLPGSTGSSPDTGPSTSSTGNVADGSSGPASESGTATTTSESSGGFLPRTDVGVPGKTGFCFGSSIVGYLANVHAREGMTVDSTCDAAPAPCGGDPVGTWTVAAHCGLEELPNLFSDCAGSTMTFIGSELSGTRTFTEELTFELDVDLAFDLVSELDAMRCYGFTCAEFAQQISGQAGIAATCEDSEVAGCTCALNVTQNQMYAGTYTVDGDMLTLTVDGEELQPTPYCVVGDRFDLWQSLTNAQAYPEVECSDPSDCEEALGDAQDQWFCVE